MILLRQMREGGDDEDFRAPSWAREILLPQVCGSFLV